MNPNLLTPPFNKEESQLEYMFSLRVTSRHYPRSSPFLLCTNCSRIQDIDFHEPHISHCRKSSHWHMCYERNTCNANASFPGAIVYASPQWNFNRRPCTFEAPRILYTPLQLRFASPISCNNKIACWMSKSDHQCATTTLGICRECVF